MSEKKISATCKGCNTYKGNGGDCPGDTIYYPTDCGMYSNDEMDAQDGYCDDDSQFFDEEYEDDFGGWF